MFLRRISCTEEPTGGTVLLISTATAVFIFFFSFSFSLRESVFVGKQKRGVGTVGLGDDPYDLVGIGAITTEQPEAVLQAVLVFLAVFFRDVAPIARHMTR